MKTSSYGRESLIKRMPSHPVNKIAAGCLIAACLTFAAAPPARAVLAQVGPVNSVSGFPMWYRDGNGIMLDLPVPPVGDGVNAPTMIYFPPSASAFSQAIGWESEAFYWMGRAILNTRNGKATATFGLEAGFTTGVAIPGNQMCFSRIRLKCPAKVAGQYQFLHPWGSATIQVSSADIQAGKGIFYTEDIGLVPGGFTDALNGTVGPFLKAVTLAPGVDPAVWYGDGATTTKVTGSPIGFNQVKIVGPAGVDMDGKGNNFVVTDQFTVSGHVAQNPTIPVALKLARATCNWIAGIEYIDVFATANPTTATLNVRDLTAGGAGVPLGSMTTDGTGKYYLHAPSAAMNVAVDATAAGFTLTSVTNSVVDFVWVTDATYSIGAQMLKVTAYSSDGFDPALSLSIPAYGGTLTMDRTTGSGTWISPVLIVPPATVTVQSSRFGLDSTSVFIAP
ncbi:MAG TPA: hypothetical protein VJA21_07545 [Verrucomicrobiae bacterium]